MTDFLERLIDALSPPAPEGFKFCPHCHGTGHAQGSTFAYWSLCPHCNGAGFVEGTKHE